MAKEGRRFKEGSRIFIKPVGEETWNGPGQTEDQAREGLALGTQRPTRQIGLAHEVTMSTSFV
jgi:hypothetical protein